MKSIKTQAQNAHGSTIVVLNLDGNSIPLEIVEVDALLDKLVEARREAQEMIDERNQKLGIVEKPKSKYIFLK